MALGFLKKNKDKSLNKSSQKKLLAYTSAAGIGAFATGQFTEASIVYSGDLSVDFGLGNFSVNDSWTTGTTYNFFNKDVDGDGIEDVSLNLLGGQGYLGYTAFWVTPLNGAEILTANPGGRGNNGEKVNGAFIDGSIINASRDNPYDASPHSTPQFQFAFAKTTSIDRNPFGAHPKSYLGGKGSADNFFWISLEMESITKNEYLFESAPFTRPLHSNANSLADATMLDVIRYSGTINGFAYDDARNPIIAGAIPEPSVYGLILALLGLGVVGLQARRKMYKKNKA